MNLLNNFSMNPLNFLLAFLLASKALVAQSVSTAQALHAISVGRPFETSVTASGNSGAAVFSADGGHGFFLSTASNLSTNAVGGGFAAVYRRELATGTITLVSARADTGGGGNGSVSAFSTSASGRWVAFASRASDLVPGDSNQVEDVFLRDIDTGLTRRISQTPEDAPADDDSGAPILSPEGRFVLFESAASNLVTSTDTNRQSDVFLWDRSVGMTVRISNSTNGVAANGSSSVVQLSENGNKVLFRSLATDLVATGDSIPTDLFLWTRSSGALIRIELPGLLSAASQLPIAAYNPVLSSDGRYLAFRAVSSSTRLVAQSVDPEGVWWFDLVQGLRVRVSGDLFVRRPIGHSDSSGPVLSHDGQRLAFEGQTASTNFSRIWIWSTTGGLKTLDEVVTVKPSAFVEPPRSVAPVLSPDGRLLAFETDAAVPTAGITAGGMFRLYLRNLATGETRTPGAATEAGFSLPSPVFHPQGDLLMFQTASVLAGFADANGSDDVFLAPITMEQVELVSRRHPDMPTLSGSGRSSLEPGALSQDGRLVVFTSTADSLVHNDTNGRRDVFVHDIVSGTNLLVSIGLDGRTPMADSWQPRISSTGRRVVFTSTATNLVTGDGTPVSGVYVWDFDARTTILASARDQTGEKGNRDAFNPQISADGESVTFESAATNLVSGVTNSATRLYLRNLRSRRTVLVSGSLKTSSSSENFGSFRASIDEQGSKVVFLSVMDAYIYSVPEGSVQRFTSAVTGNGIATLSLSRDGTRLAMLGSTRRVIYWRDLATTTNRLIAAVTNSAQNVFANVSISGDGRRVAFDSNFITSDSTDTNTTSDVFVFDIASGVLSLVSKAAEANRAGNAASESPVLSADGELVAFRSAASDLVTGDTNHSSDIFVSNLTKGTVSLVSRRAGDGAPGNASSSRPLLSGTGGTVVFQSWASDLMAGDYNLTTDLFALSPPLITLQPPAADGSLALEIRAASGATVAVETTSDLSAWTETQRITGQGAGSPVKITLQLDPNVQTKFWRVRVR